MLLISPNYTKISRTEVAQKQRLAKVHLIKKHKLTVPEGERTQGIQSSRQTDRGEWQAQREDTQKEAEIIEVGCDTLKQDYHRSRQEVKKRDTHRKKFQSKTGNKVQNK